LQPSALLESHVRAWVATLTTFLKKSYAEGMRFRNAKEFFDAGRDGRLVRAAQGTKGRWLPRSLLAQRLNWAEKLPQERWSLVTPGLFPELRLDAGEIGVFTGTFGGEGSNRVVVNVRRNKP
jgi:hypothetical protein